jgi:hypothetical protein
MVVSLRLVENGCPCRRAYPVHDNRRAGPPPGGVRGRAAAPSAARRLQRRDAVLDRRMAREQRQRALPGDAGSGHVLRQCILGQIRLRAAASVEAGWRGGRDRRHGAARRGPRAGRRRAPVGADEAMGLGRRRRFVRVDVAGGAAVGGVVGAAGHAGAWTAPAPSCGSVATDSDSANTFSGNGRIRKRTRKRLIRGGDKGRPQCRRAARRLCAPRKTVYTVG